MNFTPPVTFIVEISVPVMIALMVALGGRRVRVMFGRISLRRKLGDLLLAAHDYLLAGIPDAAGVPPADADVGPTGDDPEATGDDPEAAGDDPGAAGDDPEADDHQQCRMDADVHDRTADGSSDPAGVTEEVPPAVRRTGTAGTVKSTPGADAGAAESVPGQALSRRDRTSPLDLLEKSDIELPPRSSNRPVAWLKAVGGIDLDLLLTRDEILVGRSTECDIVIQKETVSRRHCTLLFRSGRWFIQSFDTPNGTFVNDAPVAPGRFVQLSSQDVIHIGRGVALRLAAPQDDQAPLQLHVGASTARGGRERNEDNHVAGKRIIGVADGVSSRPSGALASKIAIDMLRSAPEELSLYEFMPAIHAAVQSRGRNDQTAENMATTLDAGRLVEKEGRYLMSGVHIGDGVAVLDDGTRLHLLTTAHTLGTHLGSQDNPASKHHPDRSRLLRALGMHKNADVDTWDERAVPGHRYVLSTDGLVDALGMDGFREFVLSMRGKDPQEAADIMINSGLEAGQDPARNVDNLTVVVADIVNAPINPNNDEFYYNDMSWRE